MFGEVICDLILVSLMGKIVNDGVLAGNQDVIIQNGILMLLVAALGGFMGISCAWTASVAAQGFGNDLRVDIFKRIMYLSEQQTDKFTTGSLVTRLTNDVTVLQDMVNMILRMFVRAPIFFLGGIIFTLRLNVRFGYVVLAALPVLAVSVVVMLKLVNPMFSKVQTKLDRVNAIVQENVSGARVVKAYTREEHEIGRFDTANCDYRDTSFRVLKIMAYLMPLMSLVMYAATIAIYYIGANLVNEAAMVAADVTLASFKAGDVMVAASYITRILSSIMMVSMMFQQIARGKASADRVRAVLVAAPVIAGGTYTGESGDESSDANAQTGAVGGTVELRGVSFRYPGASGDYVLHDINLKVNPGEIVAIIGATGSGKSTLVSLLPRFYDPDEGEVLIDGVNVREYDLDALRHKFGFVLQKAELFSGSIADNIRWGNDDATDEEVAAAAETAQAAEFITGFSEGYNTYVTEKGTSLSGGQKQRVSIARAIVRRPEILIFDDSTSALDLTTEAKLQRALRENLRGSTIIMIAQRIASVKNADKIAVIEHGQITAFAPHDELMKTSAAYRDIYNSQIKNTDGGMAS